MSWHRRRQSGPKKSAAKTGKSSRIRIREIHRGWNCSAVPFGMLKVLSLLMPWKKMRTCPKDPAWSFDLTNAVPSRCNLSVPVSVSDNRTPRVSFWWDQGSWRILVVDHESWSHNAHGNFFPTLGFTLTRGTSFAKHTADSPGPGGPWGHFKKHGKCSHWLPFESDLFSA